MYIHNLPFDTHKELCRLLDNYDLWKELAGSHMRFSPFEINEIEQTACRNHMSPTSQLLTVWGQFHHRVEELFVLLYQMRHVPALNCLSSLVSERYLQLLRKLGITNGMGRGPTARVDVNGNIPPQPGCSRSALPLPVPVILLEQGQLTTSSRNLNLKSTREDSSSVDNTSSTQGDRSRGDLNEELIRQHVTAIPMLRYEELKEATNNWSESNLLGRGGFGQVYKGEWMLLIVAVKRLRDNDGKNKELIQEMCLNQYRHDNILPLYGYSFGGPEACLVYQLMAGGSLEERLRCKTHHPPLTWSQRHRIAHGVARGLQFLHNMTGTPLIHGDIKPANILLDQCTVPKIGDFGLARKGPFREVDTHLTVSRVHGTRPYLPVEYLQARCLSPAVDVFSYGVVMVEIATRLPALDRKRPLPLLSDFIHAQAQPHSGVDLATLEDRMIPESNPELCREFIAIGVLCTELKRHQRPTMLEVYKRLDALTFPGQDKS